MDRKTQNGFPESQVQDFTSDQVPELWEPPFDRWLRLTDDLLRDWPHPVPRYPEQTL